MHYRREIDGLRAVAVLPVILFHAGFGAFSGGFVGVDVFFVISGYLITGILIDDLERGDFSIARFYERRARRILPALFAVMLACLPFAWAWMPPAQLKDFGASLAAATLSLSNLYFMSKVNYFAPDTHLQPLLHTWSLAVEEQYYILFPSLLFLGWKGGRRRAFGYVLALAVLSFAFAEWGWRENAGRNFYFTLSRFWEIAAGSLCAFVAVRVQRPQNGLSLLGLGLILFAMLFYDSATPFPSAYALLPVVGTALIVLFALPGTWVAAFLSTRPLVGIGLISYSAYLWHQPVFAFARLGWTYDPGPFAMAGLSLLSLGLAYVTWRWIERPFRGGTARMFPNRRALFTAAALAATPFVGLGFYLDKADLVARHYHRAYAGDVGHHDFFARIASRYARCEPEEVAAGALIWEGVLRCAQSRKNAPIETLLLGDSHAEHLFPGLADSLPDVNVGFYNRDGLPFLDNPDFQTVFKAIDGNPRLRLVVISAYWSMRIDREASMQVALAELDRTIRHLQDKGITVVLTLDIPVFDSGPEPCLYGPPHRAAQWCEATREAALTEREAYLPGLRALAAARGVAVFDPRDLFCDAERCSMVRDGQILYRDRDHLSLPGTALVGTALRDFLRHSRPVNEARL